MAFKNDELLNCSHFLDAAYAGAKDGRVSVLTWNIQGAAAERAQRQADWLISQGPDVMILTEVRSHAGFRQLCATLQGHGYVVFASPGPVGDSFVAIAARGWAGTRLTAVGCMTHRRPEILLSRGDRHIRIIGIYVPSRGPIDQRNAAKRAFQEAMTHRLDDLKDEASHQDVIIGGDFNVADVPDRPHYRVFGSWEWEFYRHFARSGLHDSHRYLDAECRKAWSWIGREGNEYRLDYLMVSDSLARQLCGCRYLAAPRAQRLSDHAAAVIYLTL